MSIPSKVEQLEIMIGRAADKAVSAADRGDIHGEVEDVYGAIGRRILRAIDAAHTALAEQKDRTNG